jgi:hypothetical protein
MGRASVAVLQQMCLIGGCWGRGEHIIVVEFTVAFWPDDVFASMALLASFCFARATFAPLVCEGRIRNI